MSAFWQVALGLALPWQGAAPVSAPESLGPLHPAIICPGCGKSGFGSRRAARRSAATIAGRTGARRMRAYRCLAYRALWHLTSQPKRWADGEARASGTLREGQ